MNILACATMRINAAMRINDSSNRKSIVPVCKSAVFFLSDSSSLFGDEWRRRCEFAVFLRDDFNSGDVDFPSVLRHLSTTEKRTYIVNTAQTQN